MLCQSTTSAERDYWNAAAAEERAGKLAAEAVNDIMSMEQAIALQILMERFPEEYSATLELIFDNRGWPADDVDDNWLTSTGTVVMRIYRAYRALGTKVGA